jgi:hypothetical protein
MVAIEARKGCKPECSVCGTSGPVYDHDRDMRVFENVPL